MSEQATKAYGIDLGTTFSCIAHIDEYGRPAIIPNAEGQYTTPSVVFLDGPNRVMGMEAKNNAILYADQVVSQVKRHMGEPDWRFFYDGKDYTAEEISSYILRKVVSDGEMALGHPITDVVITCPAYFGINEREATAKAGEIAGLNVRSIINEPTAAAIQYGLQDEADQVLLVYDLGGGTFDITMIDKKGDELQVIATGGDHHLGGTLWDNVVVNYLAEQWTSLTGSSEDPMNDLETMQHLLDRAEQAKISLSNPARDKVDVAAMHAGQREKVTLTRETFDELTGHLLERTIAYTREMLEEAERKGYTEFDQILLVGGSTRMLQVAERLKVEFGSEPKSFEPDEAVAKGAAWYGQKLVVGDMIKIIIESWGVAETEQAPAEMVGKAQQEAADRLGLSLPSVQQYETMSIRNVTSRSFGVIALDPDMKERVSNIIRVNDLVPTEATRRFGTVEANQENADIRIMESLVRDEQAEVSECDEIGKALLPLPPGLPANSPIEITFRLNEQGRLDATGRELAGGQSIDAPQIETKRVISQEELEEAKARSEQLKFS